MSADAQLKSFIDRILRLKEEQDSIADDIRDVYAEARGQGFDKTAMGSLVGELRKKAKNEAKFEERNSVLDLYRDAYGRASHTHAPAHTRGFLTGLTAEQQREALSHRGADDFTNTKTVVSNSSPSNGQPGGMVPPPAVSPGTHSDPDARTDSKTPSQSRRENSRYESASERGRAHLELENGNTIRNHQTPPANLSSEVTICATTRAGTWA